MIPGVFVLGGNSERKVGRAESMNSGVNVLVLVIVLLVLWLVLSVVGFAIKGLVWLGIIGVVLFLGTTVVSFVRRRALRR